MVKHNPRAARLGLAWYDRRVEVARRRFRKSLHGTPAERWTEAVRYVAASSARTAFHFRRLSSAWLRP